MERCETCRHWERFRDDSYGRCNSDKLTNEREGEGTDLLVWSYDWGSAQTGKDFGCVHHESTRPEPPPPPPTEKF